MARPPEPWFWKDRDCWCVTLKGKRHVLAKGKASKAEALKAFHRLMAEKDDARRPERTPIADLCDLFLDHAQRANTPQTYGTYRKHLESFVSMNGGLTVADVKPLHVSRWLAAHPRWNESTRHLAVTSIKRVLNWAEKEGYIETSPLRHVKAPAMRRRERLLTAEEISRLEAGITDQCFRDFFAALTESGCRPGEAARIEAKHIDLDAGTWTLEFKGNRNRVIYLTPRLIAICRRLMTEHPTGPIFRNRTGKPWSKDKYGQRMRRLRVRVGLGSDVTTYLLRHAYITDGLEAGVPPATMAELAGHKDLKMISRYYNKLNEKRKHLRDAAQKVRPGEPPTSKDA